MRFPDPLIRGRLLRRYKRFLADVVLDDGGEVVAHCANPGSMMGLADPGAAVWLSPSSNPARKLKYSWELVEVPGQGGNEGSAALVGIHTGRANALVAEALENGRIAELAGYARRRAEVPYGNASRVDFLLEPEAGAARPPCYLEVKSVTLRRGGRLAEFPDAVTARGAKHLAELAEVAGQGARAVLLFLVQRDDCDAVAAAADIDPAYAAALGKARAAGVEVLAYGCALNPQAIALDRPLALEA